MKYKILSSQKPAYLQLYEQIKGDIISFAYPFGAKLPSKRILSEETGVSVITVEHAYDLLIAEGYAVSKERSGYFVVYRESDFLTHPLYSNAPYEKESTVEAIAVDDDEKISGFPFSVMAKAMRKVILDYGEQLLNKSHGKGLAVFRKELCAYLKRTVGVDATPEQVIVGAGAEYLYGLVVQLLGKDKIYAIENPCYDKIRQVYTANGVKFESLDLGKNGICSTALQNTKAQVLHVTPYNSFPSLVSANATKRNEYLQWANRNDGFVIEDNYDSELTVSKKHEETLYSLAKGENVIYINTFSKTVSAGIRVGYMILPKSLTDKFDACLGFYSCTVPVFEQLVLTELLSSGEFERHVNRVRRQRRKR